MTVEFKGLFKIWEDWALMGVNEMLYQLS